MRWPRREYPTASASADLQEVELELVAVKESLEERYDGHMREVNGLARALHLLRNARTKVDGELDSNEPPSAEAPEGSKPSA